MYIIINLILIFSLIFSPGIATADHINTLAPETGWIQGVLKSDGQMTELLWNLFEWARNWKTKRAIGAINLRKWITAKRIQPDQIKDTLIVNTTNSTLIIYPADMNELGPRLPKSNYRVYRIPRSIDIKSQHELEVIFRQADSIVVAEGIVDELKKGEIKSKIALTAEVFFWVQKILIGQGIGDRYKLERRLLLTVLLQEYPDIDPGFKSQLEEFLPNCAFLGNFPMDLTNADRFILAQKLYLNPGLLTRIQELSKKARVIYEEIDRFSPKIEMNSCNNFYSTLRSLERIISEFDVDRDFNNPENTAVRLMRYLLNTRQQDTDLFQLLKELRSELQKYKEMDVEGLDEVLNELDSALKQSETLEDFRKTRLGDILLGLFRRIPKADIHHHLDGCISPELAFRIIKKYPKLMELYGNPESPENLKPYIEFSYKGEGEINWNELWPKFALFTHIINTGLDEVAFVFKESSLEDFYNDGVTLIEHKISIITPGQDPEIDPADVLEAAVRGLIEAEEATGGKLQTGLIPCIWKTPQHILGSRYEELAKMEKTDPGIIIREAREEALRQVKLVVELKKKWEKERPEYAQYLIGIDTVGDEKDYIREVTAPALQYAAENGLKVTEHLGENWNKGELKQALLRIKQGIESGIIKRIGHATALGIETEDEDIRRLQEEIKELIRKNNIHIETCPSSNKLLAPEKSIPRYKDHPVVRFYRELGNVSINTDDSRILHTRGLSGEFMKVWLANPQLKYSDIQKIIENAFQATFIDQRVKDLKRLRELIHDIINCWGMISNGVSAIPKRQDVEDAEFRELYERGHAIFREYHNTKAIFEPRKAVDDLIGKKETLRQAGNLILSKIGSLKDQTPGEAEFISTIEIQTQQFLRLLDELGTGTIEEAQTDIIKVIRDLSIINPDITLELNIPKDLPSVLIPSSEISILRVFWNLLSNSITAGSKNIKITVDMTGNSLNIAVEDDGSGIPEELLRIPEGADRPWIFMAGHTTKTREPGEHGLGLSYVWDTIVGKWKARINVESTVGKGTKFILRIPVKVTTEDLKTNLTKLIPSPWDEEDPIVTKFIQEAISMEATKELMQLSDNELEHRLYQALQEPGIGLPDSPAPSKNWWRHVIIHLTGTAIGMRESDELRRKLEPIRQRYRYIQNLLQEWLRRNQNNDLRKLPPVRPLSDTEQVGAELELMRSS